MKKFNSSKCCNAKLHRQNDVFFCTNCISVLDKSEIRREMRPLIIASTFFIFLYMVLNSSFANAPIVYINKNLQKVKTSILNPDIEICANEKVNDSIVFEVMLKEGILFPEYALKKCKFETGHYSSNLCLNYNNLFGMTYIGSKYQSGYVEVVAKDGQKYKFATYRRKTDSIKDYKRAQKYYSEQVDKKYSDKHDYTAYLQKIK